jgi:N-acetyl-anhydromuramyl-L-alanine amidase AmpD
MRQLLEDLHRRYPRAMIVGHHDLNPHKDCPCIINVAKEYADLQPM